MAEKRMFSRKIVCSDDFLNMPLSAQALYYQLNMEADDDGFLNNPNRIQKMIGASDSDLKILLAKRFLLCFDSGVIVIKHWRINNTLRKDRYHPTNYREEAERLDIKENGSYTERPPQPINGNQMATSWQPQKVDNFHGNQMATTKSGQLSWQPFGNQLATEDSIDKESIEENRSVKKENTKERKTGGQKNSKDIQSVAELKQFLKGN